MDAIRQTALLGTEKSALDIQQLPESIRLLMKSVHGPDAEWQFLEANAFHAFYTMCGKLPVKFSGSVDETIIEETQAIASKALSEIYNKIELVDYHMREGVINLWLDTLIEQQVIVGPDRLVELIQFGKNLTNRTKTKILAVIGLKGKWIIDQDASLGYPASSGERSWSDGTTEERKQIFISMRQQDPVAAIALVSSTWETESIVNKRSFLELIGKTAVSSDIAFLENLYSSEFKSQPKEKKTEKECRRIIAATLLRFPVSTLYQTTIDNLSNYFSKGKKSIVGFVTGQSSSTFRLPTEEDEFWNAKTMDAVYGFEVKNYDVAVYESALQFWLSQFIEYLPFAYWIKAFDSDHKKATNFWLLDKTVVNGRTIPLYLQSLIRNAEHHHDQTLALTLIQSRDLVGMESTLKLLEKETFESYVLKNDYHKDMAILSNGPYRKGEFWTLDFSKEILRAAYRLTEQRQTPLEMGKLIAQFAHADAIDTLYEINSKARDTSTYQYWNTAIFQIAHPVLEIRNNIESLKSKHS